ncbi:F-box/kelch-repeat protein At3g23880-like [Neltuma alba]|uniref:F-box/kelch-repeat protein At3g23880-like n=1 Tax=Neltuma alba TaxID=207710 RepID=UPI0010A3245E|nr:F-box/kelch-repeat protein At3g23880-like [Prosopis alba]
MDKDTLPYLPPEVIISILLRLPVKSLMRFRCVCKEWKNLFKTPSFVAEHLHHSTKQNSLLFYCTIYGCTLSLLNHEKQVLELQKPPFIDTSMGSYRIVYSDNGLLCVELIKCKTLFLWNPATREVHQVPKALKPFEHEYYCCVGFGFSPIVNDYKIVRVFVSWYDQMVHRAEVYSLSTGSWKEVDVGNLEDVIDISCSCITCNGSIFWFGLKEDVESESDGYLIVSFDIAMEEFTLIQMPTLSPKSSHCNSLTLYDNKLAMLSTRLNGNSCSTDLWVMKGLSWTKTYDIKPYPSSLHPVAIWRNHIICTTHDRFKSSSDIEGGLMDNPNIETMVCNLTNMEFKICAIKRCCFGHDLISNYVESLVTVSNIHVEKPPLDPPRHKSKFKQGAKNDGPMTALFIVDLITNEIKMLPDKRWFRVDVIFYYNESLAPVDNSHFQEP